MPQHFGRLALVLYLGIGWSGIVVFQALAAALPPSTLWKAATGRRVAYSSGVIFHVWERLRFHNVLWHCFVVTGATPAPLGRARLHGAAAPLKAPRPLRHRHVAAGTGDRHGEPGDHIDQIAIIIRMKNTELAAARVTSRNSTRHTTNSTVETMCSTTEVRPVLVDFSTSKNRHDEADSTRNRSLQPSATRTHPTPSER